MCLDVEALCTGNFKIITREALALVDKYVYTGSTFIWLPRLPIVDMAGTAATSSSEQPFRVVRKNYEYLVNELRVSNYLDALYGEELLSDQDVLSLRNEQDNYDQTRKFLDILKGKSEQVIENFFEILKTRTGPRFQPHIYHRLFPHAEQRDGTSQQDDATNVAVAAVKLYAPSGSQQGEPASGWEELVSACPTAMLASLRPTLLLDHLRLSGLLTAEEYKELQQRSFTENERSQRLLHVILPAKGKSSMADFCEVLSHVEGQKHLIGAETVAKLPGEETGVKIGSQSHGPQGSSAASTDCLSPGTEHMACQEDDMASIPFQGVHSTLSKQKESFISCVPPEVRRMNCATFFFKPEHRGLIEPIENIIALMCVECFRIERSMIMFSSAEMADVKTMLKLWGHPCFMDLDSKLAVLWVRGIERDQVDSRKIKILEELIVTHLQNVTSHLELPPGECSVLEIIPSSSYIVLSLSIDLYISLLCVLGNKVARAQLSRSLQEALPGSNKAVLRLGGLPPLELFSGLIDTQNSVHKEISLIDQKDQGS